MYELYALFPFEKVPRNSRIIIYGAGKAGLNFARQVGNTDYCKVICLVDSNSKKHNSTIFGLEKLLELGTYDYVVVSPINFAVRKRIKDELISFGVPENKIVVPSDKNLLYWSLDGMLQHSIDGVSVREYDAVEIEARKLVSSNRLDIGIKWLLMRDLMNDKENTENFSLYARHIYAWTLGKEGFMPTSGKIKDGINEYIKEAKKTLDSIKSNKFDKNNPVPVSGDNLPLDGAHRIAACIESDEKIWIKKCQGLEPEIKDYKWYIKNGFSATDMQRIYKAFCDLYTGSFAIAVMYGPAMDYWDFMTKQLENKFKVVGYVDLDFESNYIAFENIINDCYFYKWSYGSSQINNKIELLKLSPLKIRVIVISDEKSNGENLYGQLKNFKLCMREATIFDFQDIELQIHSSDNEREAQNLCQVLLSPNNIKYAQHRFKQFYRKEFIDSLVNFKKAMIERKVPLENLCIINSCSMEVMGIREAKEVDFLCLEENFDNVSDCSCNLYVRKKEKNGAFELSCNYYSADKARQLILDDNCHFIFFGLKFLNLEYVKEKKILNDREKDKNDIRLIDLFNEMALVYDEKIVLKKAIYKEIVNRRKNIF